MIQTFLTWLLAGVAAVSFLAGPATAAQAAGSALSTVGITGGVLMGSSKALMQGFEAGRNATGFGHQGTTQAPRKPASSPASTAR